MSFVFVRTGPQKDRPDDDVFKLADRLFDTQTGFDYRFELVGYSSLNRPGELRVTIKALNSPIDNDPTVYHGREALSFMRGMAGLVGDGGQYDQADSMREAISFAQRYLLLD